MVTGPDGHVYVLTPRNRRVIVYAPDGSLVREISTTFPSTKDWGGTLLPDGTILDDIYLSPANAQSTTAERPRALQVIRTDGTRADTIAFPTCAALRTSDVYVRIPQGRGYMQMRVPYIAVMQAAFANDGTAWCTPADSYSLFHLRVGKPDTLHRISRDVPAPPIPDSARRMMDGIISRADNRANIDVPKAQPTIAHIRVDAANRLWVRRTATPERAPSFDLFDAQGRTLGTVNTTLRWDRIPLVVGDTAYGLVTDEDGVHYVVRAVMR
jgi:hypothetical protein